MSDNSNIRSPYPYNLFKDVKGNSTITLPESLSSDTLSGLHYVLSGLSDTEQLFIQLFYKEGFSAEETSAKLNLSLDQFKTTQDVLLKKLRDPSRWNYIQYGIAGLFLREADKEYQRGFLSGYAAGYQACTDDFINGRSYSPLNDDIMNLPLEVLTLSARAYNIFHNKKYSRIRDIASLDADSIRAMRNLGAKTADEIARALQAIGFPIEHTAWYQYLL